MVSEMPPACAQDARTRNKRPTNPVSARRPRVTSTIPVISQKTSRKNKNLTFIRCLFSCPRSRRTPEALLKHRIRTRQEPRCLRGQGALGARQRAIRGRGNHPRCEDRQITTTSHKLALSLHPQTRVSDKKLNKLELNVPGELDYDGNQARRSRGVEFPPKRGRCPAAHNSTGQSITASSPLRGPVLARSSPHS